jgi:hypothetical protein
MPQHGLQERALHDRVGVQPEAVLRGYFRQTAPGRLHESDSSGYSLRRDLLVSLPLNPPGPLNVREAPKRTTGAAAEHPDQPCTPFRGDRLGMLAG